jgi:hypothetical protein
MFMEMPTIFCCPPTIISTGLRVPPSLLDRSRGAVAVCSRSSV